jgi:hypothetical protein
MVRHDETSTPFAQSAAEGVLSKRFRDADDADDADNALARTLQD